jgi:hypothetical protein
MRSAPVAPGRAWLPNRFGLSALDASGPPRLVSRFAIALSRDCLVGMAQTFVARPRTRQSLALWGISVAGDSFDSARLPLLSRGRLWWIRLRWLSLEGVGGRIADSNAVRSRGPVPAPQ